MIHPIIYTLQGVGYSKSLSFPITMLNQRGSCYVDKLKNEKQFVAYRIEKAKAVLVEARDNARLGHWSLVGNVVYYAVHHMAQALLLDKGLSAKTQGNYSYYRTTVYLCWASTNLWKIVLSRLYERANQVTMMICMMLRRRSYALFYSD